MDAINAFERLQMLVDFIRTFPTREQLVVFMSENICPHGELAGVNTAYLDDDGVIQIQFHHGFNLKNSPRTTINITEDNPGAECLRSILAFWELINGNTSTKHIPPLQMQNRELTSRQARILE